MDNVYERGVTANLESKPCGVCGRPIGKTAGGKPVANWSQRKYCSEACRREARRRPEWTLIGLG
jgi:hypothetical protein